jgi:hypothetical protein
MSFYVAVRVKVQKNINGQLDVFAIQLSSNQVSRSWEFSQSGFEGLGVQPIRLRGAWSSTNQVSNGWKFCQSGDFGVPLSSNQVSRGSEFSKSGFERLGLQPIRYRRAESSAN